MEKIIINAAEKGIAPGKEVAAELAVLFNELSGDESEKELFFEAGEYYIDADKLKNETVYITNTIGDGEVRKDEVAHENRAALSLNNIKNLCIKGDGAAFVIMGRASAMFIRNCENITAEGIEFKYKNPGLHEFKAEKVTPFYVDYRLDRESEYIKRGSGFAFKGKDYEEAFTASIAEWWICKIREKTPDRMNRVRNPFFGNYKMKEIGDRLFRVYYTFKKDIKKGDRFYLYDVRRRYVGIFGEKSKNITLREVKQRFSYSLAVVMQDCENINIEKADFSPEKGSAKHMASIADFIQICMCRGKVSVTDSFFEGAGDDTLNVHGFHFKIADIKKAEKGGELTVKFGHPQSHGFNPLRVGDEIEYFSPSTLLCSGKAEITSSELIDEFTIKLGVTSLEGAEKGKVIEDVSACPSLYFARNKMKKIVTRGILVTTRGKVVIEDNDFIDTQMSSILFSDDAKSWYESGCCKDVTIRNNRFGICGSGRNILILPENSIHKGYVHGKFLIEGNSFESPKNGGVSAKSSESVTFRNNKILHGKKNFISSKNVGEVISDL